MKFYIVAFLSFISFSSFAQDKAANWFTNMEEAKAWSVEHDADILMVFAGSDWCRPCIQFKNDVLLQEDFIDATKETLAVLYLDFPAKKKNKLSKEATKHNEALADKYNKSGAFPKIVLLSSDQENTSSIKYKGESVVDFLASLNL